MLVFSANFGAPKLAKIGELINEAIANKKPEVHLDFPNDTKLVEIIRSTLKEKGYTKVYTGNRCSGSCDYVCNCTGTFELIIEF